MTIARDQVEAVYPLLPLQQGILFTRLAHPESRAYLQQLSIRLRGPFDAAACEASWNSLMRRHEVLRSAFIYKAVPQPLQIILKERSVDFSIEDLRTAAQEEQINRLSEYLRQDRKRDFGLKSDPLIRLRVFLLAADEWEMVWSHPHLLLDGWSASILIAEFDQFYACFLQGGLPSLPPSPSHRAYIEVWERQDKSTALAFWRESLAGFESSTGLPRGWKRPASGEYVPRTHSFHMDARETAGVYALARRLSVTPAVVLQALWAVLLSRYNDTGDVLFGAVVSGRDVDIPAIERAVGMFANSVPVRVRIEAADTLATLVRRRHAAFIEESGYVPVSLADTQAAAWIDHLFVVENFPVPTPCRESPLRAVSSETSEYSHYDFAVLVQFGPELKLTLAYNGAAFSPEAVQRTEGHWRVLWREALADPDRRVASVEILPHAERSMLAEYSLGPRHPFPQERTLADLWDEQAAATPHRPALISDREQWSYRELNWRADAVAAALARFGLPPQQPIAAFLPRGGMSVASLLGVLKAGHVYFPIDPTLPEERIGFMLRDSRCAAILTDEAAHARAERLASGLPVLAVTTALLGQTDRYSPAGRHDAAAYLIYTSGSTGWPKGVLVEHAGFINMILDQIRAFGITGTDRVLQFAPLSFDASLSEIFHALLTGAALVVPPDPAVTAGEVMIEFLNLHQVTVATFPPSYLRALDRPCFPSLRVLISAGEAVGREDWQPYQHLRFFNAYGPTETSVCATYFEAHASADYAFGLPIGRPIANLRVQVLDRRLCPVPLGVAGEICVSGPGLAREYVNAPELTREKFVYLPDNSGDLIYRTGDRGFWSSAGDLVCLGRIDHQVKFNGHRIELGEIERVLEGVPGVRQVSAVLSSDRKELLAYWVGAESMVESDLRRALAAHLPSYMMPSRLLRLSSLPVTHNGKVDRAALSRVQPNPKLEPAPPDGSVPLDGAAADLVEVVREVCGVIVVSLDETFSDLLGGDSLKALQVVGRLRQRGWKIDLPRLIGPDTLAQLSLGMAPAEPKQAGRVDAALFALNPVQHRFFAEHTAGREQLVHTVLLAAAGPIDEHALISALAAVWAQHDSLRTGFRKTPSGLRQYIGPLAPGCPFEVIDLREASEAMSLIKHHASAAARMEPFEAALFRANLIRTDCGDFLLLLAHHLVIDAVSWQILLEDISACYKGTRPLPETASCRAWIERLYKVAHAPAFDSEMRYWEAVDALPPAPLPTDSPYTVHTYADIAEIVVTLHFEEKAPSDRSVEAFLLSTAARALHIAFGVNHTRFLVSGHGRIHAESNVDVSRTVGWFTAEYPVVMDSRGTSVFEPPHSGGIGYGIYRWARSSGLAVTDRPYHCRDEITFNFHGAPSSINFGAFSASNVIPPAFVGPDLERRRIFEIDAWRSESAATLKIRYSPALHRKETMLQLQEILAYPLHAAGLRLPRGTTETPRSREECGLVKQESL